MAETNVIDLNAKPEFVAPTVALVPIKTDEEYRGTAAQLKALKDYESKVEAFYAPRKKRAYDLWQAEIADEKKYLAPAQQARKQVSGLLTAYDDAKERERIAEEQRLAEEARKRAEQELIERAAAAEKEAARTGDAGLAEEACDLIEEAQHLEAPPVQLQSFTPKVDGLSYRVTYSAKATDLKKLIKWVAKNIAHANLLKANDAGLNALARAQQDNFKVDGAQLVKTKTPVGR